MIPSFVLNFKQEIRLEETEFVNVLHTPIARLDISQFSPGMQAVIRILVAEGATEDELSDLVLETDGFNGLNNFNYYLHKFQEFGILSQTFCADGLPIATVVPLVPDCQFQFREAVPDRPYILSRFAYCRSDKNRTVLESPLSKVQVVLSDWRGGAIVSSLSQPQICSQSIAKIPAISEASVQAFLGVLLSAGMLDEMKENEPPAATEALAQWEFHDLLFHARSRIGRHSNPAGKTYRFKDKIASLPVVKMREFGETIELYKPDIDRLKNTDRPFTWVLEERKSLRRYGQQPITDKQLGEFLYRSARIKNTFSNGTMECSKRPYPSGGACYELELYIAIARCENIPPGLYHYCPQNHSLSLVSELNEDAEKLLKEAGNATGEPSFVPQILIILAARFPRVSWAYESVAYALILKDAGALYQTMYLVATAMDLAPSAIGSGNADLFAKIAGTDYYAESSVGEFILGSNIL
ncbi:MAG: SagB family peptide dehydrogenase [Oscillatoriaceae cyanobacterium Prado104]|jgi:SagB-type dehydrogenase family enzyme|nr:SagB family peptide dehydrogenase [Oscillatoriaceae cyanobacterium Prado104]